MSLKLDKTRTIMSVRSAATIRNRVSCLCKQERLSKTVENFYMNKKSNTLHSKINLFNKICIHNLLEDFL